MSKTGSGFRGGKLGVVELRRKQEVNVPVPRVGKLGKGMGGDGDDGGDGGGGRMMEE